MIGITRPGTWVNPAYIYGVTISRKKIQIVTFPASENASFFGVHAPMHVMRVAYIYGVYPRNARKVHRPKAVRAGWVVAPGRVLLPLPAASF